MIVLYLATALALVASFCASREKTVGTLKRAARRFVKILPAFLTMLTLFSVGITLMPQEVIQRVLGRESGFVGVAAAAALGSIALMPGFIAFPLSGALLRQDVPYTVLAAFTATLMTVGVVTYPLERQYFGPSVTLVRNGISLLIALVVATVMGLVFGEIPW